MSTTPRHVTRRRVVGGAAIAALFSAGFATPAMAMSPEVTNVYGLSSSRAISDVQQQQQQQQQQKSPVGNSMAAAKPAVLSFLAASLAG